MNVPDSNVSVSQSEKSETSVDDAGIEMETTDNDTTLVQHQEEVGIGASPLLDTIVSDVAQPETVLVNSREWWEVAASGEE